MDCRWEEKNLALFGEEPKENKLNPNGKGGVIDKLMENSNITEALLYYFDRDFYLKLCIYTSCSAD